jgi:hypothetical protein
MRPGREGALYPANPYGAALPWPDRVADSGVGGSGHRLGRRAGALVVTVGGLVAVRSAHGYRRWRDGACLSEAYATDQGTAPPSPPRTRSFPSPVPRPHESSQPHVRSWYFVAQRRYARPHG